ncbi:hypothetical protein SLA_2942 [Streptomyces laurentii]|uniref:Uncharacterized protein n=1 Tax=Streptomyces laurentii TaxID=39478 RepID=A0A169NHP0_STRLU|nr:hypothetical protein SLA_2942 [Streptomyces laurentii]
MFEIRIICDPADTDRVTGALAGTLTLGTAREYPTRDSQRTSLYITADHLPTPEDWPTPQRAYVEAPRIVHEISWVARTVTDRPFGEKASREFWLRKAALLDRIALDVDGAPAVGEASEAAEKAAHQLLQFDLNGEGDHHGAPFWPEHPASHADPRGYVRQEYAHWTTTHP